MTDSTLADSTAASAPRACRTRIKFCGLTRAEDLHAAVHLGVDAIGLICVPGSKRCLAPADAAALRREVPPLVSAVLLVGERTPGVQALIEAVQPDLVQFHGGQSEAECRRYGRRYLKTVAVHRAEDILAAATTYASAGALLLDTPSADGLGGTGRRFDWTQIPAEVRVPLMLAGGLRPENVGQAVRMAAPYAVDVSSGIEASPGRKDLDLMRAFVAAVRQADAERDCR